MRFESCSAAIRCSAVWHVVQICQRPRHQAMALSWLFDRRFGFVLHRFVFCRIHCPKRSRFKLDFPGIFELERLQCFQHISNSLL
jgi:hypothetical protein